MSAHRRTGPESEGEPDTCEPTLSSSLRALAESGSEAVTLATFLSAAGTRAHGLALFLLVLPETLPVPLPSASSVLGVPLLLISLHLALFGDEALLPARVLNTKLPRAFLVAVSRYVVPILAWTERHSRARWRGMVHERQIGIVCLFLSIILLLPIPFMNAPPAICMAIITVGLVHRDGALVTFGIASTAVMTVAFVVAAEWLISFL
jgi:hypothetical protein